MHASFHPIKTDPNLTVFTFVQVTYSVTVHDMTFVLRDVCRRFSTSYDEYQRAPSDSVLHSNEDGVVSLKNGQYASRLPF